MDVKKTLYRHHSGLKIIPGSLSLDDLKGLDPNNLNNIFKELHGTSELVVVDSSPGLTNTTLAAMNSSDDILIITNQELPAIADSLRTIKMAERLNKNIVGVVVTKYKPKSEMSAKNIELILEKPIVGVIPEDKHVSMSLMKKDSVVNSYPESPSALAYKKLAADLIGVDFEIEKKNKLAHKIFRYLGLR
jgi:septum site-determining protein MinD